MAVIDQEDRNWNKVGGYFLFIIPRLVVIGDGVIGNRVGDFSLVSRLCIGLYC